MAEKIGPIERIIHELESAWMGGFTPTILVDGTRRDVVFPEPMKRQFGIQMPVALKAPRKGGKDFQMDVNGIRGAVWTPDGDFQFYIPWKRVWAIMVAEKNWGLEVSEHLPRLNKRNMDALWNLESMINAIWDLGHLPRIVIDATRKGVAIPEHVKAQWGEKMPIDLLPSMQIDFQKKSIVFGDLSFNGVKSRCIVPEAAIYAVINATIGEGIFHPYRAPESVARESVGLCQAASRRESSLPAKSTPAQRSHLRLIKGGKS